MDRAKLVRKLIALREKHIKSLRGALLLTGLDIAVSIDGSLLSLSEAVDYYREHIDRCERWVVKFSA
jgi:hypothetical protein